MSDKPCALDGCDRQAKSRGYCPTHYARILRHGDPGTAPLLHAVSWMGHTCSITDCDRPVMSMGWCNPHYKRKLRYGDPLGKPNRIEPRVKFDTLSAAGDPSECWLWAGTRATNGYGVFRFDGKSVLAHRHSYETHVGPIPEGLVIDHLCRTRACVNPAHLEPVTNMENLARGNGYAVCNGMRDTCIHGHEYTEENTYVSPKGEWRCRTCARERDRNRRRAA